MFLVTIFSIRFEISNMFYTETMTVFGSWYKVNAFNIEQEVIELSYEYLK